MGDRRVIEVVGGVAAGRGVTVADEHHVSKSGDQGKGIDQVEHKTSDRPPFLLSCQCGPSDSATGQ